MCPGTHEVGTKTGFWKHAKTGKGFYAFFLSKNENKFFSFAHEENYINYRKSIDYFFD